MSLPSLYRLFYAHTGFTVKEYIRSRRLSKAALELGNHNESILQIAVKYGFKSHEAFTRAFKKKFGLNPGEIRSHSVHCFFERINLMDQHFEILEQELAEKYPKIKVLKQLAPFKVVSTCYVGKEPEYHAWKRLNQWLENNHLKSDLPRYRFFGFNNPSPTEPDQSEYGYEVWVTLTDNMRVDDPDMMVKTFSGGLYAIRHVSGDPAVEMFPAWQELREWLADSPYELGNHQWLEEHLDFDEKMDLPAGFDLYMPIRKK
jgi:AraC-like DNA-binding protein/DNA gyrase inhibitor GyrI